MTVRIAASAPGVRPAYHEAWTPDKGALRPGHQRLPEHGPAPAPFPFLPPRPGDFVTKRRLQVAELVPTQHALKAGTLAWFDAHPEAINAEPIKVVEHGGLRYIHDGHHRAEAARRMGQRTVAAFVAEGRPRYVEAREYVRKPKGDPEGGEFAPTGDVGSENKPVKVYHGTALVVVGKILKQGLHGEDYSTVPTTPGVYVTEDFKVAAMYAGAAHGKGIIFELRVPNSARDKLHPPRVRVTDNWVVTGRVPPEWIAAIWERNQGRDGYTRRTIGEWRKLHGAANDGRTMYAVVEIVDQEVAPLKAAGKTSAPLPRGGRAMEITSDLIETRATIDAGTLVRRLEDAVLAEAEGLFRAGLGPAEVADALEGFLAGLSDKALAGAARNSVGLSYNLGRNLEIQRDADQVAFAIRTELIDSPTICDPCKAQDGRKYEAGSDAYFENMRKSVV